MSQGTSEEEDDLEHQLPPEQYDPEADDEDARWAAKQRRGRASDAVLSCPACFTTICIDCQQHAQRSNQFRAVFVMNCDVGTTRIPFSTPSAQSTAGKRRRSTVMPTMQDSAVEEVIYPVLCGVCGTELGVRDEDEVYHFYHCLASTA